MLQISSERNTTIGNLLSQALDTQKDVAEYAGTGGTNAQSIFSVETKVRHNGRENLGYNHADCDSEMDEGIGTHSETSSGADEELRTQLPQKGTRNLPVNVSAQIPKSHREIRSLGMKEECHELEDIEFHARAPDGETSNQPVDRGTHKAVLSELPMIIELGISSDNEIILLPLCHCVVTQASNANVISCTQL